MIRRSQFIVHPGHEETARHQFARCLEEMPGVRLYVTVEQIDQYAALRSKLAKRAAKKRK